MIQDQLLAAIKAALPGVAVYDAIVPETPAARYVVVYFDMGLMTHQSVEGRSEFDTVEFQVTYVASGSGLLRQECQHLVSKVRAALVDRRFATSQRSYGQVEHTLTMTVRKDETVKGRPTVFAVDQFTVEGAEK